MNRITDLPILPIRRDALKKLKQGPLGYDASYYKVFVDLQPGEIGTDGQARYVLVSNGIPVRDGGWQTVAAGARVGVDMAMEGDERTVVVTEKSYGLEIDRRRPGLRETMQVWADRMKAMAKGPQGAQDDRPMVYTSKDELGRPRALTIYLPLKSEDGTKRRARVVKDMATGTVEAELVGTGASIQIQARVGDGRGNIIALVIDGVTYRLPDDFVAPVMPADDVEEQIKARRTQDEEARATLETWKAQDSALASVAGPTDLERRQAAERDKLAKEMQSRVRAGPPPPTDPRERARQDVAESLQRAVDAGLMDEEAAARMILAGGINNQPPSRKVALDMLVAASKTANEAAAMSNGFYSAIKNTVELGADVSFQRLNDWGIRNGMTTLIRVPEGADDVPKKPSPSAGPNAATLNALYGPEEYGVTPFVPKPDPAVPISAEEARRRKEAQDRVAKAKQMLDQGLLTMANYKDVLQQEEDKLAAAPTPPAEPVAVDALDEDALRDLAARASMRLEGRLITEGEIDTVMRAVPAMAERIGDLEGILLEALTAQPCHVSAHRDVHQTTTTLCFNQLESMGARLLGAAMGEIDVIDMPRRRHLDPDGNVLPCCERDGNVGTWVAWGQTLDPNVGFASDKARRGESDPPAPRPPSPPRPSRRPWPAGSGWQIQQRVEREMQVAQERARAQARAEAAWEAQQLAGQAITRGAAGPTQAELEAWRDAYRGAPAPLAEGAPPEPIDPSPRDDPVAEGATDPSIFMTQAEMDELPW